MGRHNRCASLFFLASTLMPTGTLQQEMHFNDPCAVHFFNCSTNKLIVACSEVIFVVDVSTKSKLPFSITTHIAHYRRPRALTLSGDDAVLVVGNNSGYDCNVVCGYDTASRTRLWIRSTVPKVGAVCMLGKNVLATLHGRSTLVLDYINGTHIVSLPKAEGYVLGLGVIEGLCFLYS